MNSAASDLKSIFAQAAEFESPTERAAYLDEACRQDAELRAQVDDLLAAAKSAGSFMHGPAIARSDTQSLTPVSEGPGTVIGPYKLLEQIGEGGMGVVFMAEQTVPVQRTVALKIIKPGMDTRQVIARFEAERQALAMMDHPNIARVVDAGTTETGRPYFVMDLVKGIPITDYCDAQHLTIRQRLELFTQVCHAVQHAHQKGIIHRDLKPSNVLLAEYDGKPVPKIIDFGVAKATAQRLTERTMFTEYGQLIGTFEYMSPEQARLNQLDVDTRSDIYSLGVLLYELLTGATPFEQKRLREAAFDEVLRIIREEEPPKPSTKLSTSTMLPSIAANRLTEPTRLSKDVRGELDWIVMRSLEKDRSRRYPTASALADDLEHYLADEPVQANPPSVIYRLRKFARRNRMALTTTVLLCGAMVIGTIVSTWQAIRAVRAEREQAQLRLIADRAREESESQRIQTEQARTAERRLREDAELREAESRRQAYASDITLAQHALAENRFGTAQSVLNRHRPQADQQDLRGWEWRYLWQNSQGDALFRLCKSDNAIWSLAASSDGKLVAVGEANESGVSIRDLRSRREVAHLPAGNADVYVAFSPTAPLLAFSSISGSPTSRLSKVQLWDAKQQSFVAEIKLGARCRGLAFAADGQTLVTATAEPEQRITLWKVPAGNQLASFEKNLGGVDEAVPLAVTPDLELAAYGSWDGYGPSSNGMVHVIDLSSGGEQWSALAADEYLITLAFSPDGNTLATGAGYQESAIRLWDVANGKETKRLEGHSRGISSLLFSADGKRLISASTDRTIRIWDIGDSSKSNRSRVLRGHDEEVWPLALFPDGQILVSGSDDGEVYVWDTGSVERRRSDIVIPGDSTAWRFAPDGRSIVTLNAEGMVQRWLGHDFNQADTEFELDRDFDKHNAVISQDNRWLAIRRNDDTVEVWDLHRHAVHQRLLTKSELPWQFFADGTRLVVLEKGSDRMHVWEVMSGARLETWQRATIPDRDYQAGDISPDDRWCMTISGDGAGVFRDILRGRDMDPHLDAKETFGTAFSADSKLFATTSGRGAKYTKVWDTTTKREIANLGGGGHSVAFSPDGRRLVIGGDGAGPVGVWDLDTRRQLVALAGKGTIFFDVAFSPDGNTIGCRNSRGELHLWRAPSWDELK